MARRRATTLLLAIALAAAGAWGYAERELRSLCGARMARLPDDAAAADQPLLERRVGGIELPRHGQQHLPWRRVRVRFIGFLQLREPGPHELRLVANGAAVLRLDGREILSREPEATAPARRARLELGAGSHALEVDYANADGPHLLRLLVAEGGRDAARIPRSRLFPDPPAPTAAARAARAEAVRPLAAGVFLAAAAAFAALRLRTLERARAVGRGLLRRATWFAPLLVLALAAVLRLEALVNRRWQDQAPLPLRQLAVAMWDLHPAGLRLAPEDPVYEGDPFTYLRFAREMRGFYDAHVREPLFVASAKGFLWLLGGADIGLSVTSVFYATLLVGATYLLGATFFSRSVGILAALALAVERHSVSFAVEGWRDDCFAFFTALTLAAIRRVADEPRFGRALGAGLAAAAACLTRITSLSFVLPSFVWLAVVLRQRDGGRRALLTAFALFGAALSPFLLSCWIAFDDPLHSINAHTVFYRGRAGLPYDAPMSALRFLGYERGPFELLDVGLAGLTSYPFFNKWTDFDDWVPEAATILGAASAVGLAGFFFDPRGRLLLIALVGGLLPYATTWTVTGGSEWRLTLHAYPFYLVAAFWALSAAARREGRGRLARALGLLSLSLAVAWPAASGLHFLRVREELHSGKPAFVSAGWRDLLLFSGDWSRPQAFDNGFAREKGQAAGSVRLPLAPGRGCGLVLRLRPAPGCGDPCDVDVALEGRPLSRIRIEEPAAGQERFGIYPLRVGPELVHEGTSRLTLGGGKVSLWYVKVEPEQNARPR